VRELREFFHNGIGEVFHTAFRKATDCPQAHSIWQAIQDMPENHWESVLDFVWRCVEDIFARADKAIAGEPEQGDNSAELWAAAVEVLEVADLRGDTDLPHPADDLKPWTARMRTAWEGLRVILARVDKALAEPQECICVNEATSRHCPVHGEPQEGKA